MSRIILASGSFLKNFVMEKSKLDFEVIEAAIDESIFDDKAIEERVRLLAENKADKVAADNGDVFVIAADTLTCDETGKVFSKPEAGSDSFRAAMELSGKTIGVYTGCCVVKPGGQRVSTVSYTSLTYQHFDADLLRRLINGDNGAIRSGALGIFFDAPGFTLIEKIEGSYSGAYGLPMEFIYSQLGDDGEPNRL